MSLVGHIGNILFRLPQQGSFAPLVHHSKNVISSAPKSGFFPHVRNGCATIMSCCDLSKDERPQHAAPN
jgi:hypothetical protein